MVARILRYIAPLGAGQLLQLAAAALALAVLGRRIGALGLAAAVAPLTLCALCAALFAALPAGAMVLHARARACGDARAAWAIEAQGFGAALIAGALFAAAILLLDTRIIHALGVAPELSARAAAYLRVAAAALPVAFCFSMYAALLQSGGGVKRALAMLAGSTALFAALVLPCCERFGAPGVALASCLAMAGAIAATGAFSPLRPHFAWPSAAALVAMAAPDLAASVQYAAVMLAETALLAIVNGYGPHFAAAFGIANLFALAVMAPIAIFATAISVFAGEALGAGNMHQALRALRVCLAWSCTIAAILTVLAYVFAAPVTRAFTADRQTLAIAHDAIFAMLWSVPVLGIGAAVSGLMDAAGERFWPAAIAIAGVWLILVPCAHAFSAHAGAIGVWQAYPVAYATVAFVQVAAALVLQKKRRLTFEAPSAT